jgi:4,5-DOPA dioxygenase extradiol
MLPTLFLSHGAPTLLLHDSPATLFLRQLARQMEPPRAVVVMSAHWCTPQPQVSAAAQPTTIHDFYGFPAALSQLHYAAPGDPALAQALVDALAAFGAQLHPSRGFDHGTWVPLSLLYPEAQIPVVTVSVQPQQDAAWHLALGQHLAAWREQGVLFIGSGSATHNLAEFGRYAFAEESPDYVRGFSDWVAQCAEQGRLANTLAWETQAPFALRNHPTPEHWLPWYFALGAAGGMQATAQRMHSSEQWGILRMDMYAFNAKAA